MGNGYRKNHALLKGRTDKEKVPSIETGQNNWGKNIANIAVGCAAIAASWILPANSFAAEGIDYVCVGGECPAGINAKLGGGDAYSKNCYQYTDLTDGPSGNNLNHLVTVNGPVDNGVYIKEDKAEEIRNRRMNDSKLPFDAPKGIEIAFNALLLGMDIAAPAVDIVKTTALALADLGYNISKGDIVEGGNNFISSMIPLAPKIALGPFAFIAEAGCEMAADSSGQGDMVKSSSLLNLKRSIMSETTEPTKPDYNKILLQRAYIASAEPQH